MARYILRRVLQLIPVFLGATLLIYALIYQSAQKAIAGLGGERGIPPAVADQLRHQFHLDEPFFVQYFLYLKGLLTLDFGRTFAGREVADIIAQAFPVTFQLALVALVIEAVFGIGVGVIAGLRKGGVFDSTFLVVSLVVIAVPTFVIGFVLQFVFAVQLGWFPATVGVDVNLYTLFLPGLVLGSVSFAYVLRLTRAGVAENLTADHVRTARAKGLSRGRVVSRHVLRNSLIPVVTFLGADLGALMGGAIVTEGIFNVPGIGNTLFRAVTAGEGPLVVTLVSILVVVYLVANLLVDLLYATLDPRIRYA